jgi:hypothetical protein
MVRRTSPRISNGISHHSWNRVLACSDVEVLTLAVVRHPRARRSERAFRAEVRREWAHCFPHVPHRSEFNRRVRWLWGAFEGLRQRAAATLLVDPWQQVDTSPRCQ